MIPRSHRAESRSEPTIDSVVVAGSSKLNGKSGYTFELRATDQGEPGRQRDTFSLVVKDSAARLSRASAGRLTAATYSRRVSGKK